MPGSGGGAGAGGGFGGGPGRICTFMGDTSLSDNSNS